MSELFGWVSMHDYLTVATVTGQPVKLVSDV